MNADPLKLKNLPELEPPPELWNAIAESLDGAERLDGNEAPARTRATWRPMLLVASLATVALSAALVFRAAETPAPGPPIELPLASTAQIEPASPDTTAPASDERLAALQRLSAVLEDELERNRGGVLSASGADVLARIEQELAWLDARIGDAPGDTDLWTERVALLGEMNRRYRDADRRAGTWLASY